MLPLKSQGWKIDTIRGLTQTLLISCMKEISFIKKQGRRIVPHYGRSNDFLGIRWLVVSMTPRKHVLMKCLINIKIIQRNYENNSVALSGTRKKDNTVPQTITSLMNTSPISDQALSNQCLILGIYHGKISSVATLLPLNQLEKADWKYNEISFIG